MSNREEQLILAKIEAIKLLIEELRCSREQRQIELEWFKSHLGLATKQDLKEMEKRIMATQAEIVADLKEAVSSLKQVNIDIKDTQDKIDSLNVKVAELEAIIAQGGTIGQELVDTVAEVKSLAKQADEALPNPVVVPPNP